MRNKNIVSYVISMIVVACVASLLTFSFVNNSVNKRIENAVAAEKLHYNNLLEDLDVFCDVKEIADEKFVGDVNYSEIDEKLAEYYVELLNDKYSEYLTKQEMESYMSQLSGNVVGIGVTVFNKNGKIFVEEVVEGSPAQLGGIVAGESIVAVNGVEVNDENYLEAIDLIPGEEGTDVSLTVEGTDGKRRDVTLTRKTIVVNTVFGKMLEGDIGYIVITRFSTNTKENFETALDDLLKKGAKGLLFDVRDNPGGELNAIVGVLDRLLPAGPVVNIVYGDGKTTVLNSTDEESVSIPMAVLINENTASAAELFASALRDYNVAKLYGKTTYGKGYMQNIIPLPNGGGLRISVAEYNPPYGENYEGVGVAPHYEVSDDASTEADEQFEEALKHFAS